MQEEPCSYEEEQGSLYRLCLPLRLFLGTCILSEALLGC